MSFLLPSTNKGMPFREGLSISARSSVRATCVSIWQAIVKVVFLTCPQQLSSLRYEAMHRMDSSSLANEGMQSHSSPTLKAP
eukprot:scaffold47740_cov17-Tisochrysis_lutea.AAC.1